jgi:hypothetical protein
MPLETHRVAVPFQNGDKCEIPVSSNAQRFRLDQINTINIIYTSKPISIHTSSPTHLLTYLPTYLSIALCWGLGRFFSLLIFLHCRTPGRGISPSQGRYLHTGKHKHRTKAQRHPCLKWYSNPRSQCSSGRRQFMPSRLSGHCGQLSSVM